jgi:DNA mismatch repair protein MutL
MSISVLSAEVIDQIAAGEVVERPAHLVKELVENSLDAGAKKITVEFSEGGRNVKVSDDGQGIPPRELASALERFATSKISQADDLWKLSTFGFRGEALASISAVSRLTLTSKQPGHELASRVISEFGQKSSVENVGGSTGTQIVIEELFANVPARLKFMKSVAGEHGQIKQTLKALALSHPQVEFQIFENQQLAELWPVAANRLERTKQILNLKKMYYHEKIRDGFQVEVVFASPHDVGRTSKNIWLFAQDRWIQDRTIQAAVMESFRNLLMHGEYPMVAVWVRVATDQIDVNIHPTKSQVKFADSQMAFRAVQSTLREALEKAPWLAGITTSPGAGEAPAKSDGARPAAYPVFEEHPQNLSFSGSSFQQVQYSKKSLDLDKLSQLAESRPRYEPQNNPQSNSEMDSVAEPDSPKAAWSRLQVLAQAHLTYLVCQSADKMVFVDQHAAHERVMFERLMRNWQKGGLEVQDFLFPLAVDLSPAQIEALLLREPDLQKVGISVETLGPQTLGVTAAPAMLKESALPDALEKMAEDLLDNGGSFAMEKMMADLCARLACHSAVRAGQSLSHEQMVGLLGEMDEFPLSSFCPHGRPVSVEYPFHQLERDFGRIV